MHARTLVQRLVEGGVHITDKAPHTSVATSLKRDTHVRNGGVLNTFEATGDLPWDERCEAHRLREKDPVFEGR